MAATFLFIIAIIVTFAYFAIMEKVAKIRSLEKDLQEAHNQAWAANTLLNSRKRAFDFALRNAGEKVRYSVYRDAGYVSEVQDEDDK